MALKKLIFFISLNSSLAFQGTGKTTQKCSSQIPGLKIERPSSDRIMTASPQLGMLDWRSKDCTAERYQKKRLSKRAASIAFTTLIPATILFGIINSHPWGLEANPSIEAEVLSDMSHVALDFLTLLNPDTLILRAASVIGRILSMTSDYVLDNKISPDDLIFQTGTLTASTILLAKSAFPLLSMGMAEERKIITFRDKSAYQTIFRPAGISWMQYLMLLGTGTMEWIDYLPPKTVLPISSSIEQEEEQHVYWLYQGDVEIQYYGNSEAVQYLDMRRGKSLGSLQDMGLLADTNFIEALKDDTGKKTKLLHPEWSNDSQKSVDLSQASTITIGSKGATALKINMVKLMQLTKNDDKLDASLRNLFLKAMHRKLSTLLAMKLEYAQG